VTGGKIGRRARIAVCLGLATACERPRAPAVVPACDSSLITSIGVGAVENGMPLAAVAARCAVLRDTTELNEGAGQRVVYALVAGDTLRLEIVRDSVWRIAVRSPTFATSDSLRVGMSLSRFLTARAPTIGIGEGKVYVFDRSHPGNSFGLSAEAFARVSGLTPARLHELPASTVIDEILVTNRVAVPRQKP
jgi:hypothetical protein